jgi:hypothetical protein
MQRAHPSEKVVLCLATFLCAGGSPRHALAAQADRSTGAQSTSLIRDRRQVPPDPLAGLPEEEPEQRRRGGDKERNGQGARDVGGRATCRLAAKPESDREVGDLRAAVAVIQRGPRTEPCTAAQIANPLRLRLSIDSQGKITAVEILSGDEKLGEDLGRRLVGQVSLSKVASATAGVTQIRFRRTAR